MGSALGITFPGGSEWVIILLLFVLLFGAKKLPELGSSVGRTIKNFKKGVDEGALDEGEADADVEAQEEVSESSRDTK